MNERVWIYTLSKALTTSQRTEFEALCDDFVSHWTAHEMSLDASFEVRYNRFLVIRVNEDRYNASGCSIDKQLRFIKQLEQQFGIELLNRLLVAYKDTTGEVHVVRQSEVKALLEQQLLDADTIVFNNTVSTSTEMLLAWEQPLKTTWLSKYLEASVK